MDNYTVDRVRWSTLTIFEQMGNIYSEFGRTTKAKKSSDKATFQAALARALDLFDATTEVLIDKKSPKAREVLLAKYQFLSLFFSRRRQENEETLDKYFRQFAIAARLQK